MDTKGFIGIWIMDEKEKNINKDSGIDKDSNKANNKDKKKKRRIIIATVIILDLLIGLLLLFLFKDSIFGNNKEPEVEEPNNTEEGNKENKLYDNLIKLANIKIIDGNSLSEGNYINNLSSLEYDIDKVTYCAYTNDIDGAKYFIS
ncbi:MAG: hypothetical protein K6E21_02090, partial [Bacilli bacterium]|nr:hypothetical protein [Bacilli bacterium]